jgi:hypothetical protein
MTLVLLSNPSPNKNDDSLAPEITPVILATQEAEVRRIEVRSQPGQIVLGTLSRKTHHKKGLVEWLKVKALSSSHSTAKKKKKMLVFLLEKE